MKVIKPEPVKFQPITIVIETQEELDSFNDGMMHAYDIANTKVEAELYNVLAETKPGWG